jgi:streptogramin lyase
VAAALWSLQRADLFGKSSAEEASRLVTTVLRILGPYPGAPSAASPYLGSPEPAGSARRPRHEFPAPRLPRPQPDSRRTGSISGPRERFRTHPYTVIAAIAGLLTLVVTALVWSPWKHTQGSTPPQAPQSKPGSAIPRTSGVAGSGRAVMPTASNCSAPRRVPVRDVGLPGGLTATEFVLPHGSQPVELAADRDGNFWFTEFGTDKIGWMSPDHTFVECQVPTPAAHPFAITVGPDGNMWFTEGNPDRPSASGNRIGVITPQGQITEYVISTLGSAAVGITKGPDGDLWFTEYQASKIGRITVTGQITETSLPSGRQPDQIIAGPDGNLWFTEFGGNKIGRLTPGGALSEFPKSRARNPVRNPVGIVSRDGTLWFAEVSTGMIGRMSTGGMILGWIPVPNREQPGPANLAVDRHDAVWFTEVQSGRVGYIANAMPFSVSHEYAVTVNGSLLIDIIIGPDGNPWFTVQGADLIGRITRP